MNSERGARNQDNSEFHPPNSAFDGPGGTNKLGMSNVECGMDAVANSAFHILHSTVPEGRKDGSRSVKGGTTETTGTTSPEFPRPGRGDAKP